MSELHIDLMGSPFQLATLPLTHTDLDAFASALQQKVNQAPNLFQGAQVVVNLEPVQNATVDIKKLFTIVQQSGLVMLGISHASAEQKAMAKHAGVAVLTAAKVNTQAAVPVEPSKPDVAAETSEGSEAKQALTVQGTIRSGQQIYAQGTDLIVMGTVSNGAEVIADGNIHIYGTLRGRAIAGAKGDAQARIFCQKLEAELVSINGTYQLSDGLQGAFWGKPAKLCWQQDAIDISDLI